MDSFKLAKEKYNDAVATFKNGNYKKAEELLNSLLEKCAEYTEIKKLYIESLLQNNKPKEVLAFISQKLNDEEKMIEEFDYYTAKAMYFNGE